ncbi:conserved hypothetical protein [Hyella patelloides LEGE 07179]|uniref:DUF4242 domain-containing protein n=1 Tax=Hyella patelloides LEGE 07179 TaxID=945734 RepID=A0A563W3F0_9CYAN|nr:nickel-binding protein [Hyella patelloides]VEP18073.1 conserved hypothetical protein [Hyella patelloides LEGE 07179]
MVHVVIEATYNPPLNDETMEALEKKITPCLKARNLIWIRSLISRDGRRSVCEYKAADTETVREVYRQIGINVKSAWVAEIVSPD